MRVSCLLRTWVLGCALGLGVGCASDPDGHAGPETTGGGVALGEVQEGLATYYAATGEGHCSFEASPGDLRVAAMNRPQYAGGAVCGECVEVEGPRGSVTVRIVDSCPECAAGHLDLSREAFAQVADVAAGRVGVRWRVVSCAVTGSLSYRFKEGSSQWWTALQVRNHRLPIQRLEWRREGGAWAAVERKDYNYFVVPQGVGPGPFQVRVTATDGQQLEDRLPSVLEGLVVPGAGQFQ